MDISYTDLTRGISAELGQLRSEIPDTLQAFHALGKADSGGGGGGTTKHKSEGPGAGVAGPR